MPIEIPDAEPVVVKVDTTPIVVTVEAEIVV